METTDDNGDDGDEGDERNAHGHTDRLGRVRKAVRHAAHLLPSQAPLEVFVHHNTLHAFEGKPFFEALADAEERLSVKTLLPERTYRDALKRGRITKAEVEWALSNAGVLGQDKNWPEQLVRKEALAYLMMRHSLRETTAAGASFLVHETDALEMLRRDVPASARERLLADGGAGGAAHNSERERAVARSLWETCAGLVAQSFAALDLPTTTNARPAFFRVLLTTLTGSDPCFLAHQTLIPFAAAFLDRGEAQWSMSDRMRGFYLCFESVVTTGLVVRPAWGRELGTRIKQHLREHFDAEHEVLSLLDELGIEDDEIEEYLTHTLLHLRGWAGMFARLEQSQDPVLHEVASVRLVDFLAVLLELEAMSFLDVARQNGYSGTAKGLLGWLRSKVQTKPTKLEKEPLMWALFQLVQVAGIRPDELKTLSNDEARAVLSFVAGFSEKERLPIWQVAYERHYRDELLGGLSGLVEYKAEQREKCGPTEKQPKKMQVLCCFDDREESFRRHLEATSEDIETLGTAGFFNLAMAYQGLDDPTTFPLCPVVVTPKHKVVEQAIDGGETALAKRKQRRARWHKMTLAYKTGTRSLVWGSLVTAASGLWTAVPLLLTVFAPGFWAWLRREAKKTMLPQVKTQLSVRTNDARGDAGLWQGFSIEEKAERVGTLLENVGLTRNFADLVVLLGHDSHSVNNPHFAAYACGACGGRSGGPNARLFARMANRREVRALLRKRGIDIPDSTQFVGGVHDTCDDEVTFFDVDQFPHETRRLLHEQRPHFSKALSENAKERVRRFETAPLSIRANEAKHHVEERAADLSQARPELGHATIAAAVVGRRSASKGLFLDRRVFLISYDPTIDASGAILERLLLAALPVGAGINLEYFFSAVDNERLGAGTKLPHNVTGLFGVMNGACSDLRTGLPSQMIEIHEPVRLQIVIEQRPSLLQAVLERQPNIAAFVKNEWVAVMSLDPETGALQEFDPQRGFVPWRRVDESVSQTLPRAKRWADWFHASRTFLPPALLDGHDGKMSERAT